jgi:hypothetical protein
MKKIVVTLALLVSFLNGESLLNINLNESDIEFTVDGDEKYSNNSKIYRSIGYIKADNKNDNSKGMAEAEMMVIGLTALPGISIGMGIKAIATKVDGDKDIDDKNAAALAIKLKVIYTLPLMVKSYLTGSYAYAPNSLSFTDLDNYYESKVEVNFEVIDGGLVYVGARNIELEFEDIDEKYTYNNSEYFGVKFIF